MTLETKASLEGGIIGSGHRYAAKRLDAQGSTAGWVGEQMGGLAYLEFIRGLVARIDADWDGVVSDMQVCSLAWPYGLVDCFDG